VYVEGWPYCRIRLRRAYTRDPGLAPFATEIPT
jgi:hypothetical protein